MKPLFTSCILIAKSAVLATSLIVLGTTPAHALTQTGPVTVANSSQISAMGIADIDAPFSTYVSGSTNIWYHSENWGNTHQRFTGSLGAPCGTLTWEKTRAQLFTNNSSIDGRPWIINTYKASSGILAFLHIESAGANGNKGRCALAFSTDNGNTFRYLGNIVSPYGDPDMTGGFMQGCPYLVSAGNYFYVYFTEGNGRIAGARALVADVIAAAGNDTVTSWKKFYNGAWNENGLGGNFTPVGLTGICHTGAARSSYNGVSYAVTTSMTWGGIDTYIKLWQTTNFSTWILVKTIASQTPAVAGTDNGYQYASIVNIDGTSNGTVGQQFYIYCGYRPYSSNMSMLRWTITL